MPAPVRPYAWPLDAPAPFLHIVHRNIRIKRAGHAGARSLIIQANCGILHGELCDLLFLRKVLVMKKMLIALAAVATLATSAPAQAGGGRVAAGVAAGLLGGALVGGAIAAGSPYGYGPGYYAPGPGPYYYGGGPAYVAEPEDACYWQRQRFWDGYGWRIRRVRVCE
jgi:hypothetical protein